MILMLKIKNTLAHQKKIGDKEPEALFHEDSCQAQDEISKPLGVDHTTDLKRLKA